MDEDTGFTEVGAKRKQKITTHPKNAHIRKSKINEKHGNTSKPTNTKAKTNAIATTMAKTTANPKANAKANAAELPRSKN